MPLKTQEYIHSFFLDNNGKNYLAVVNNLEHFSGRMKYFNFRFALFRRYAYIFRNLSLRVQSKLRIDRLKNKPYRFFAGTNWCSLTDECVRYILKHEKFINKMIRFAANPDESYKQIILYNSSYDNTLINNCLRFIDWSGGGAHPKTFTTEDYDRMIANDCLFARKFDENVDMDVVYKLCDYVNNANK